MWGFGGCRVYGFGVLGGFRRAWVLGFRFGLRVSGFGVAGFKASGVFKVFRALKLSFGGLRVWGFRGFGGFRRVFWGVSPL